MGEATNERINEWNLSISSTLLEETAQFTSKSYHRLPDTFDLYHDLTRLSQADKIFFQEISKGDKKSYYQYAGRCKKISTLSK